MTTYKKMDPDIKERWVDALRSGVFKQGQSRLRDDTGTEVKHCCLGVLCALAQAEGVVEPGAWYTGSLLPRVVSEWAGLGNQSDPYITEDTRPGYQGGGVSGSHANDGGATFEEIAAAIRANL